MTKVATIDTRKFLALLLLTAMLATMIPISVVTMLPGGVLAGDNSTVSSHIGGTFTVNDGSFSIHSATVYTTTNSSTTTPSPAVAYHVKVDVENTSGLDKLTQVNAILYYDADGTYSDNNEVGSDAAQTHATLRWTPAGDFVLDGPGGTWSCDNSSSVEPADLASKTRDVFEFHVTIGKVATYTPTGNAPRWFAYGSATDAGGTVENVSSALAMQWYGEINAASDTLAWSGAAPGTDYTVQTVSVTYVSNGVFNKGAEATSPWTPNAVLTDSDTLGSNQFALKADDTGTLPDDTHRLISSAYRTIGSGTQTSESPSADTIGVWLKLGAPFTQGAYSGTIYLQISN